LSFVSVGSAHPQLAFGLGRRFGNAVERNRARRRLRAAFETAWAGFDPDPTGTAPTGSAPTGAYLITADRGVLELGFEPMVAAVRSCLTDVAKRRASRAGGSP
jgi:RNase P protein component